MTDLVLRPSGFHEARGRPWALQLRHHGPAETDYATIAHVSDETAKDIIAAGAPYWLFGQPDWDGIHAKRELERAKALREEAARIEATYSAGVP